MAVAAVLLAVSAQAAPAAMLVAIAFLLSMTVLPLLVLVVLLAVSAQAAPAAMLVEIAFLLSMTVLPLLVLSLLTNARK